MSVHAANLNLSHKFPYKWNLSDGYPAKGIEHHGTTVMTTFACGGGSTMGYKLAGYDVIAANDIDPQMAKVYKANHHPKQFFLSGISELLERDDLPKVDVLDGSPPCSVFSMAGSRESAWGKDKVFREGQAKQILDDLFFQFLALVEKMQPKVVIAENVKGMLVGNAKWYTREIVRAFNKLGYKCQVYLLNAASMGVPQKRERVFFIAYKGEKSLELRFNEPLITYGEVKGVPGKPLGINTKYYQRWLLRKTTDKSFADITLREEGKNIGFTDRFVKDNETPPTITAKADCLTRFDVPNHLSTADLCNIGSFPADYNFAGIQANYLIGMSVPPVMMAQVAHQVYEQLIKEQ